MKLSLLTVLCVTMVVGISCSKGSVPEVVSGLSARYLLFDISLDYDGTRMNLNWQSVDGADSYHVFHAGSRWGELTHLNSTRGTSFYAKQKNRNRYENYYKVVALDERNFIIAENYASLEINIFGQNVLFFDSKYDNDEFIEREINRIHDIEMFGKEFTTKRYAMFFKPGEYLFNEFKVGFYTHLGGLGKTPNETTLKGTVTTPPHLPDNNATCTFWRSIENFQISPNNRGNVFRWGVSQSSSVRRMLVNVPTFYHYHNGWASGGFTADSRFNASVDGGSQQQWYTRNSYHTYPLTGVVWNNVIQGTMGNVEQSNDTGSRTKIDYTPIIREKPFLYIDNGEYKVFVPALRHNVIGTSWNENEMGEGESLDLFENFYIAKEGVDTAASVNTQLNAGKHIYFTSGRYELEEPIRIRNAGTIILGHGFPTLYPADSNKFGALFIDDVENVTVAGLMFDATPANSIYLLAAGDMDSNADHSAKPTLLADLCLRVGGFYTVPIRADISVLINSNNVIGDHLWVWRADHGVETVIDWDINTSRNGVVVRGDDVTMYGLFVEHFHEYTTLWMGDRGRTFFYQNEAPYDPHWQSVYRSHNGTVDGWAQYKVANNVNEHYAVGLGVYCVFMRGTQWSGNTKEPIYIENAIEVPHRPNVRIQNATTVYIGTPDNGGIRSIVNGTGQTVENNWGVGNVHLLEFVNGVATLNQDGIRAGAPTVGREPQDEEHLTWLTGSLIP